MQRKELINSANNMHCLDYFVNDQESPKKTPKLVQARVWLRQHPKSASICVHLRLRIPEV